VVFGRFGGACSVRFFRLAEVMQAGYGAGSLVYGGSPRRPGLPEEAEEAAAGPEARPALNTLNYDRQAEQVVCQSVKWPFLNGLSHGRPG